MRIKINVRTWNCPGCGAEVKEPLVISKDYGAVLDCPFCDLNMMQDKPRIVIFNSEGDE